MKLVLTGVFTFIIVFISCTQGQKTAVTDQENVVSAEEVRIKDEKVDQIFEGYIALKNALIASDPASGAKAGAELGKALEGVKGCENTALVAKELASVESLAEQRKKFTLISADIIPLIKQTEIISGSVYMQYCPMANHGDGGYWLAAEPEVKNPYYGDEMLNCGEVKEEFKSN